MEYFTLSNGVQMPAVGIGTFMMSPEQAEQAVYTALQMGYKMIDTANAYMNERAVGRAMRASGVAREEIYMAGYRLLEKAYKEGKIKAIGISNFHDHKLENLLAVCEIKPHVIQLEEHPYFSDTKTLHMLSPYGVRLMAWYPLGHGDKGLLNEPVFAELATKYGKTTAQIILRWHTQNGTSVIPGSTNADHIRENADIFDFTLTEEEMAAIKALDTNTRFYNPPADMEEKYAFFAIDLDSQP